MKNKKFMKKTACVMALTLMLANGIVTCAQTKYGSFTRSGSTASVMLTGTGKVGGATNSISSGDYTKVCFAQVVPTDSLGIYMAGGNYKHQLAYVSVICTAPNNKHKKFAGVYALKNDSYRPYGSSYNLSVKK